MQMQSDWLRLRHAKVTQIVRMKVHGTPVLYCNIFLSVYLSIYLFIYLFMVFIFFKFIFYMTNSPTTLLPDILFFFHVNLSLYFKLFRVVGFKIIVFMMTVMMMTMMMFIYHNDYYNPIISILELSLLF